MFCEAKRSKSTIFYFCFSFVAKLVVDVWLTCFAGPQLLWNRCIVNTLFVFAAAVKALTCSQQPIMRLRRCCYLSFFVHNSITVDEVKAKVALVHDEERVLSEDEAVVSCLLFIRFVLQCC